MPPALVIVGASDILLEDSLTTAARLTAAGGRVDVRVFPESPHGFTAHPTSMASAAWATIASWVDQRLTGVTSMDATLGSTTPSP
jgi:acetyl esterase